MEGTQLSLCERLLICSKVDACRFRLSGDSLSEGLRQGLIRWSEIVEVRKRFTGDKQLRTFFQKVAAQCNPRVTRPPQFFEGLWRTGFRKSLASKRLSAFAASGCL